MLPKNTTRCPFGYLIRTEDNGYDNHSAEPIVILLLNFSIPRRSSNYLVRVFLANLTFLTTGAFAVGADWPVLKTYTGRHLEAIAMPLGGIGTGTVSLSGRGSLVDWEVVNRSAIGWVPAFKLMEPTMTTAPFFLVYARPADKPPTTLLLEGPIPARESNYSGDWGADTHNAGMPRFERNDFRAAYPLAQVSFEDDAMPLHIRLEAFNPLVPGDPDKSGLPVVALRYVLNNPSNAPIEAAICGAIPNFIGSDGWQDDASSSRQGTPVAGRPKKLKNQNEFRSDSTVQGVMMTAPELEKINPKWGTFALTTTAREGVSYRTAWKSLPWHWDFRDFWDDFSADGALTESPNPEQSNPPACLAVKLRLAPGETKSITFLLTWHFPNRQTWYKQPTQTIGNYYTAQFADAWDAAVKIAPRLESLERETVQFVRALVDSDYPAVLKEAALFNVSILRSQTMFRTPDGHLFGWEGSGSINGTQIGGAKSQPGGWGMGSCTHVWNYEVTTPFLFGQLAMGMREVEFLYSTNPATGKQAQRVILPLKRDGANDWKTPAADGQMGTIVKMYRDWQLSGDTEKLRSMWPHVKAALAYAWKGGVWDINSDGVMEGAQHNTMDVAYVGPNPLMAGWYLAALRAGEEMARAIPDTAFGDECRSLYSHGRTWVDANLFNGENYVQRLPDPAHPPEAQLGECVLVDQLVGQYLSHIAGLGYILDQQHVKTTLRTIRKDNWVEDFGKHFNTFRSFALGKEQGLVMGYYPIGKLLDSPFPYYGEVMTGFEYSTAAHMIMEGLEQEGLDVFKAVRARYDGEKRNPFDEEEFGHRYGRAMASWAGLIAWSGFNYSAVTNSLRFAPRSGIYFWSNGYAYGTIRLAITERSAEVEVAVQGGNFRLEKLVLTGYGQKELTQVQTIGPEQSLHLTIAFDPVMRGKHHDVHQTVGDEGAVLTPE
jgi:non-lysosomal glucosylceramidase